MQHPLFEDGRDLPLFTLTPVPVPDLRVTPAPVARDQLLLLEPACRTCFDGGEIRVGPQVRFCWCLAGQARQRQQAAARAQTTPVEEVTP